MATAIVYPNQAKELLKLLQEDQVEKKAVGKLYFSNDTAQLDTKWTHLETHTKARTRRMLKILDNIGRPSLTNHGEGAAQAVSILAVHDDFAVLDRVLSTFNEIYMQNRNDCYYQAIPSMTDRWLILQRRPQRFGTQWMFDAHKEPFLITVADFAHVNERRKEYGIEPLRWPKSLAIPSSEQPWLKKPIASLSMRDLTPEEYRQFVGDDAPDV